MMTRSVKTGESAKKNSFILISSVSIPAQISLRDHHGDMMKLDLVAIGVSHVFPMGPWAGRYYLVVWRLVTSHILYHHISSFSLDNPLSTWRIRKTAVFSTTCMPCTFLHHPSRNCRLNKKIKEPRDAS
jgi:hypothetical protein